MICPKFSGPLYEVQLSIPKEEIVMLMTPAWVERTASCSLGDTQENSKR